MAQNTDHADTALEVPHGDTCAVIVNLLSQVGFKFYSDHVLLIRVQNNEIGSLKFFAICVAKLQSSWLS